MLEYFLTAVKSLISSYDVLGLLAGMFFSSSILPIPSEAILVYAGTVGIPLMNIVIFGSIGASLGSVVGYYIGSSCMSFLKKYGKYFFINPENLKFVEDLFKKWGNWGIVAARVIPFIPYKIFSIGCGFGKMRFKNFFIFTLIGSIPRCFLLSYFGYLISLTKNLFLTAISIGIFFILPILVEKFSKK
jgi:membrane protein DedA with SNARE-associated domain